MIKLEAYLVVLVCVLSMVFAEGPILLFTSAVVVFYIINIRSYLRYGGKVNAIIMCVNITLCFLKALRYLLSCAFVLASNTNKTEIIMLGVLPSVVSLIVMATSLYYICETCTKS